eukprot:GILJ01002097.1.p1 GENE.GILJ01002097.1~~GILJ01002097.1.p1  ORF type:complete len:655 (-),score=86.13 GILJ01002097.1:353-2317(-)
MKLLFVLVCVSLLLLPTDAGGCAPCASVNVKDCLPCLGKKTLRTNRVEVQPAVMSPMHTQDNKQHTARHTTQDTQTSMAADFTIPEEVKLVIFDFDETITRKDSSESLLKMGFESFVRVPNIMSRSFAKVAAAAAKQHIPVCIASANDQNMVQPTRWTEDHAAFGGEKLFRKFFKRFPSVSELSDSFLYAAAYPVFYKNDEKCRVARKDNFLSRDGSALSDEELEKVMPCPNEWHSKDWQFNYCVTQALKYYRDKGMKIDSIPPESTVYFDDHSHHFAYGKQLGMIAIRVPHIPLLANQQLIGVKAFGMAHWCAALHQLRRPCPFVHVFEPRLRLLEDLYRVNAAHIEMPYPSLYPLVEGRERARYLQAQPRAYKPILRALLAHTQHISWLDFRSQLLNMVKNFVARTKHLWAESDVCLLLRGLETTRQMTIGPDKKAPSLTIADRESWVSLLVYGMLREQLADSQTSLFIHYDLDSVQQQAEAYNNKRRVLCIFATDMLQELNYDLARVNDLPSTVQVHLLAPYVSAELGDIANSKGWVTYESILVKSAQTLLEGFGSRVESILEGVDSRAPPIYFDHGLPQYAIDSLFSGTVWNKRYRLPVVQNCDSSSSSSSICPPSFSKTISYRLNSRSLVHVYANTMDLDVVLALTESN